jgi:hypothetical protein
LAELVNEWPRLPEVVKECILMLVDSGPTLPEAVNAGVVAMVKASAR